MPNYYTDKIRTKFADALQIAKEEVEAGKVLTTSISARNEKMGEVASVSTLPFITCPARCAKSCGPDCYAAKLANIRPSVLKSYARNTALAMLRPELYWMDIKRAMMARRWFRFHVSGDILNKDYFERLIEAVRENPHCEALVFTKRYEIVNAWIAENGPLPENLHLLFSGWSNLAPINPHKLPETTVYDKGEEPREEWLLCGGNCFECGCRGTGCWKAGKGETVAFKKH